MAPKRKSTAAPTRRFKRIKAKRDSPPTLLTLPAEIRNVIAALVLSNDEVPIEVRADLPEPAFLSTNRQIRSEYRQMWLRLKFLILVQSLPRSFVRFMSGTDQLKWDRYRRGYVKW